MKFAVIKEEDTEDPIVSQDSDTSSAKCLNSEQAITQLVEEIAALKAEKEQLERRCWLLEEEVHTTRSNLCQQEIYLNNARSVVCQYKIQEHKDALAELKMKFTSSTESKTE